MPLKAKDVEDKLLSKFHFSYSETRAVDHVWMEISIPGLPVISTKLSHSITELSDDLVGKMAKQVRVRANFFRQMIGCTKSRDEYIAQVCEDPFPPFEFHF